MNPVDVREQLLSQHRRLRALLVETSDVLVQHTPPGDAIEEQVHLVRQAFDEHNRTEEKILGPFLAETGTWAQARIDRMVDEHVEEHAAFDAFLARPLDQIESGLPGFIRDLQSHMDAEERLFLNEAILRDNRP